MTLLRLKMIKIGVVSDTHSKEIPAQLLEDFKKVDLIIHAGDFCARQDLDIFKNVKDVKAVWGNMDGKDIRSLLPRRQIIHCGKFTIGLFHGEGAPKTILETVKNEFKNEKPDVIIFGHSHQPLNQEIDGVLFFNPGSPNDTISAPYCSYGVLEIGDKIKGKIVKVSQAK